MSEVLISSYDMEVGGVERSLISMLSQFDYSSHKVDLMLCSHTGEFMSMLPPSPQLLEESSFYKTFRMSIRQTISSGNYLIGMGRLIAKCKANLSRSTEKGYKQMQYMWKYALPFLPMCTKEYDVAISYLWPHYYVAEKVNAEKKIAWIHTDFSNIDTDIEIDLDMWSKFHNIVAVSEDCKNSFIIKYPQLKSRVIVIENIMAPNIVRSLAEEKIANPMDKEKRFKLVTVGRLTHAKGIDNAVLALKTLKESGYDVVWYVVGYGGDEAKIRSLIKDNNLENSFILLGKQINPYPYMKKADLYVQPSRYEGKAVTVGEAQILGRPVLITNFHTAKSQLDNGFDGHICEMSIEGITEGIIKLYEDDYYRNSLSNNCTTTDYSNSEEIEKLYKLILK